MISLAAYGGDRGGAVGLVENGAARDKDGAPRPDSEARGLGVYAAVGLQLPYLQRTAAALPQPHSQLEHGCQTHFLHGKTVTDFKGGVTGNQKAPDIGTQPDGAQSRPRGKKCASPRIRSPESGFPEFPVPYNKF